MRRRNDTRCCTRKKKRFISLWLLEVPPCHLVRFGRLLIRSFCKKNYKFGCISGVLARQFRGEKQCATGNSQSKHCYKIFRLCRIKKLSCDFFVQHTIFEKKIKNLLRRNIFQFLFRLFISFLKKSNRGFLFKIKQRKKYFAKKNSGVLFWFRTDLLYCSHARHWWK